MFTIFDYCLSYIFYRSDKCRKLANDESGCSSVYDDLLNYTCTSRCEALELFVQKKKNQEKKDTVYF